MTIHIYGIYIPGDVLIILTLKTMYCQIEDFPGGPVIQNPPPTQGTQFQSLVRECSTCPRETKPRYHNYWSHMPRACALQHSESPRTTTREEPLLTTVRESWCTQLVKSLVQSPCSASREASPVRACAPQLEKSPCLLQLEQADEQQQKTQHSQK